MSGNRPFSRLVRLRAARSEKGGERKLIGGHKADVRPCAARGEPGRQQVRVTDQGDGQGREGGRDA